MNQALARYARSGINHVSGWISRINAEVFASLLDAQDQRRERGGLVEIGVHHGKSANLLSLAARDGETFLAIDIFDDQHLNLDQSGRGDRTIFERNVAKYGNHDRTEILQASSLDVTPEAILQRVGPVRFFSIDGGHWFDVTLNDLKLAAATLAAHGVIALDDFDNAEFPEVSAAFYAWFDARNDFIPFAITRGKLYICNKAHAQTHRAVLKSNGYLEFRLKRSGSLLGNPIDMYLGYFREGTVYGWLRRMAELRFPEQYERARQWRRAKTTGKPHQGRAR
jgi:hypothetical protein